MSRAGICRQHTSHGQMRVPRFRASTNRRLLRRSAQL